MSAARAALVGHVREVDRIHLAALALVVLAGAGLRLAFLREPMRFDEAYSFLTYAMRPPRDITLAYDLPNNHVLNTLLMHLSWQTLGNHITTLRLPNLLAGCAAIPAAYWAGRELYDRDAGLWAAALVATSSPLVDFSVNARGYMLGLLFVLLCLGLGARLVRAGSPWAARAFIVCAGLAAWSVPTMALPLGAVGMWMFVSAVLRRPRDLRRVLHVAATLALGAFVGYVLYWPLMGQTGWTFTEPLPRTWDAIQGIMHATWLTWNRTAYHPLDWITVAGFVAALVLHRRIARQPMPLPLAGLLALAGILLFGPIGPFPRSWVGFAPLFLVCAAAGLAALTSLLRERVAAGSSARARLVTLAPVLVITALLVVSGLRTGQAGSEEPPNSDNDIVGILKTTLRPGEQVLIDQLRFAAAINYYLARESYGVGVGLVTDAQRKDGRVLILVPRDQAAVAASTVGGLGGRVRPNRQPRLVRQMPYLSLYSVEILP